jgi:hypothetical protein
MRSRAVLGLVLLHAAGFSAGCVWLAGLGDPPLPLAVDAGDSGEESSSNDAGTDGLPVHDSAGDSPVDAPRDSLGDAPADSSMDSPVDSPTDAPVDSRMDAPVDSRGDSPVDSPSDAPPWSPAMLSGLVLWLEGGSGLSLVDGGSAIEWLDRSGQHNDATTAAGAPTINSTGIAGQPAVSFNGSSDYLVVSDSTSLQLGTGDFAAAVVAAHSTPLSQYGMFYVKQNSGMFPYFGLALVANANSIGDLYAQLSLSGSAVSTASATYNDGHPFVFVAHRFTAGGSTTPTVAVRVNGVESGSETAAVLGVDLSAPSYPVLIGGTPNGQDVMGNIAAELVVKGPVSDGDIASLEAYLMGKYGL